MAQDITGFLAQLETVDWFQSCGTPNAKHHMASSVFEAYDSWNSQMLAVWEPRILVLEEMAQRALGDPRIDEVFAAVSHKIGDALWTNWGAFIKRCHLEKEAGLENEIMDMVKRDMAWACIEALLGDRGLFTGLLEIYREGYFPCAWIGSYPGGQAVVM